MDNNNDDNRYTNYNYTPESNQNTPNYNQSFNQGYPQNYSYNNYDQPEVGKGKSIAAMICGICSIVLCWCYGICGVILGIVALILQGSYKNSNNGRHNSMSKAALITGIIGLVLSVIALIFFIIVFASASGEFWEEFNRYYYTY